ncbi:hypothetical protein X777_05153, partial [Ooceraea biroi]
KKFSFDVIFTITNKLDILIKRGKDKLTNVKKMGVVYKLECGDCDSCYGGQTKRHLETRIKEHLKDINKTDYNLSVVSRHRFGSDHEMNWSNVKILHQESQLKKREIAEMVFIKRENMSINSQDTEKLPGIYDNILINS